MSWTRNGLRGSQTAKSAATSISMTTGTSNVTVGEIAICWGATSNLSTTTGDSSDHTSMTDSSAGGPNTWTKLAEKTYSPTAAADDGVTVSIWMSKIAHQLSSGSTTVTMNYSGSATVRVIALMAFSASTGNTPTVGGTVQFDSGGGSTPTATISGLGSQEYLFLALTGIEGPNGDTFTNDANYTTDNAAGTTGNPAASNNALRAADRILTGTGDTYASTLGTARDYGLIFLALQEQSAGFTATGTDTATVTDAATSVTAASTTTDSHSVSETLSIDLTYGNQTEITTVSDAAATNAAMQVTDSLTVSESASAQSGGQSGTGSDTGTVSETAGVTIAVTAVDSVTISEVLSNIVDAFATEAITESEAVAITAAVLAVESGTITEAGAAVLFAFTGVVQGLAGLLARIPGTVAVPAARLQGSMTPTPRLSGDPDLG